MIMPTISRNYIPFRNTCFSGVRLTQDFIRFLCSSVWRIISLSSLGILLSVLLNTTLISLNFPYPYTVKLFLSLYYRQTFPIPLLPSNFPYPFITVKLSLSLYYRQTFPIPLLPSNFPYPFITVKLSLSLYYRQTFLIPLLLSNFPYPFITVKLSFKEILTIIKG
jgi:hypothetical protein